MIKALQKSQKVKQEFFFFHMPTNMLYMWQGAIYCTRLYTWQGAVYCTRPHGFSYEKGLSLEKYWRKIFIGPELPYKNKKTLKNKQFIPQPYSP